MGVSGGFRWHDYRVNPRHLQKGTLQAHFESLTTMPDALDPLASDLVVQRPAGPPQQLILLFHGVGSTPQNMEPLGRRLAAEFPQAAVVCIAGPDRCDLGAGHQWFSVQDITEENRAPRIAATLPRFAERVRAWQRQTGATEAQTALIGFSQGAIMALEAVQAESELAGRVIAVGGRYATLPAQAPQDVCLHLLHGMADAVLPYRPVVDAAKTLVQLGADVTADVLPDIGHELHPELVAKAMQQLRTFVPAKVWREAMQAAEAQGLVPKE